MDRKKSMNIRAMLLTSFLATAMRNTSKRLTPMPLKIFTLEANHFSPWLGEQDLALFVLDRTALAVCWTSLAEISEQSTIARMWIATQQSFNEDVRPVFSAKKPAQVLPFSGTSEERISQQVGEEEEAMMLQKDGAGMSAVSVTACYQLLSQLFSAIRCAAMLALLDGRTATVFQRDNPDRLYQSTAPTELPEILARYLQEAGPHSGELDSLLVIGFRRDRHAQEKPVYPDQAERMMRHYARAKGSAMLPRGMRSRCITLAFTGGADLALVQEGR